MLKFMMASPSVNKYHDNKSRDRGKEMEGPTWKKRKWSPCYGEGSPDQGLESKEEQ